MCGAEAILGSLSSQPNELPPLQLLDGNSDYGTGLVKKLQEPQPLTRKPYQNIPIIAIESLFGGTRTLKVLDDGVRSEPFSSGCCVA